MHEPREIKEIIWDADNTIWNWVRYPAKAYPKMAEVIARETGIPYDDVVANMKEYYTLVETMESPWLIQGLEQMGFFKRRARKPVNIDDLRFKAKRVFQHYRDKYFQEYEEVKEIMKKAHENGIRNRILTDAPKIQAIMRVKRAEIEEYITKIHTLKTNEIITELPLEIKRAQDAGKYDIECEVEELDVEKPDTRLEDIIEMLAQSHEQKLLYIQNHTAIFGDSDPKDMGLVRKYGCLGFHAAWEPPKPEEIAIVKQFAPETIMQKNLGIDRQERPNPTHSKAQIIRLESRREIEEVVPPILKIAA